MPDVTGYASQYFYGIRKVPSKNVACHEISRDVACESNATYATADKMGGTLTVRPLVKYYPVNG